MFLTPGTRQKAGGKSFPTGTQMMFVNPAAPLGWVRVNTFDDALMRIVGSASPGSGGANGFVAAVNGQTGTGTGNTGTGSTGTGSTGTGSTGASSTGTGSTGGGTSGSTTPALSQAPPHTHSVGNQATSTGGGPLCGAANAIPGAGATDSQGGGGSHNHSIPALSVPALSIPALSVPALSIPALTVPSLSVPSLSVTFGIKYVDALIAKKN